MRRAELLDGFVVDYEVPGDDYFDARLLAELYGPQLPVDPDWDEAAFRAQCEADARGHRDSGVVALALRLSGGQLGTDQAGAGCRIYFACLDVDPAGRQQLAELPWNKYGAMGPVDPADLFADTGRRWPERYVLITDAGRRRGWQIVDGRGRATGELRWIDATPQPYLAVEWPTPPRLVVEQRKAA